MNPKIEDLANLIRDKKENRDEKFVILLGAGASFSSGVPTTEKIMEELLSKYGQNLEGELRERFDRLWIRSDVSKRDMFLRTYLDLTPSCGYAYLSKLINKGYFDLVITFNFDRLLEKALEEERCRDFNVVVRAAYHNDSDVREIMLMRHPRVKILKLHGGINSGDTFLFSQEEMHNYPEKINSLLLELTREDIIVCGYAFEDACVERAFSETGGNIFCVNPETPKKIKMFLRNRKSEDWIFDQDSGKFDNFFSDLYAALESSPGPIPKSKANPFKFLLSYNVCDSDWFFGRSELTDAVLAKFKESPPKIIHLMGDPKVGKTSLVRAGVMAKINPERFLPIYIRCQKGPLESWLFQEISKCLPLGDDQEKGRNLIKRLADLKGKHLIVILDQFERVIENMDDKHERDQLLNQINCFFDPSIYNFTFMCVGTWSKAYSFFMLDNKHEYIYIEPLKPKIVGQIISEMAQKADVKFDAGVIDEITRRYEKNETSHPFSLAHVMAVCNILADFSRVDLNSLKNVVQENGEALDEALNTLDIVSYIDDIPDDIRRNLFRKVMKIVPVESKKALAQYLKNQFSDLFAAPEYFESLSSSQEYKKNVGG